MEFAITHTVDDIYDLPDGERAELIDGKIYYSGRLNRRIKVNGELICVEDLEELISKCNLIKSCCIVGKAEPQKGTVPVAFVPQPGGAGTVRWKGHLRCRSPYTLR